MNAKLTINVDLVKIPEPGPEFIEWCDQHDISGFGNGEVGRRGWCDWLNEYIRDNNYLVYIKEGYISSAFFATEKDIQRIITK